MFADRRARVRSYQTIETIANEARRSGHVATHSQFNVVDFIIGPLILKIAPNLQLVFFDKEEFDVPAFVRMSPNSAARTLYVSKSVWAAAKAGVDQARFILSHEIGHILMHNYNELAYCNPNTSFIDDLQPEERVEPQANLFGDLFLVPENMLDDFNCADDIADYFNVPIECAHRRYDHVVDKRRRQKTFSYSGDACSECANFTLIRNGMRLKCRSCGVTIEVHD